MTGLNEKVPYVAVLRCDYTRRTFDLPKRVWVDARVRIEKEKGLSPIELSGKAHSTASKCCGDIMSVVTRVNFGRSRSGATVAVEGGDRVVVNRVCDV
jgi:hypothetical protein